MGELHKYVSGTRFSLYKMKLMGSKKLLVSDNEREPSISKVSFKRQLPFPNLYSPLPKGLWTISPFL